MKSQDLRSHIPLLEKFVYLDSASTSQTPRNVIEAMNDYFINYNANTGRGAYRIAIKASQKLDYARENLANFISASPNEVVFTKNTTEAINIVANGLNLSKDSTVIISDMEHHSNYIPWINLKNKGVNVEIASSNDNGIIDIENINEITIAANKNISNKSKHDNSKNIIAISHITNSIGSKQNINEISEIAKENDTLFLVDAAQSIGHTSVNTKKINADFIAFPGHKGLLGPVGTGGLYINKSTVSATDLAPLNLGGGTIRDTKEYDFDLENVPNVYEGGTLNIAGFIGLSAGIDYINKIGIKNIENHNQNLKNQLIEGISSISGLNYYGDKDNIDSIVSFNINGINSHDLAKILDETSNICIRSGHHCAIPAMNHLKTNNGTCRASFHYYNNSEDINKLVDALKEIATLFS
ncbi:MAG: aminotransferase class V-fold PLP-dependent enzyme [Methanobacteriaceae archaeon]